MAVETAELLKLSLGHPVLREKMNRYEKKHLGFNAFRKLNESSIAQTILNAIQINELEKSYFVEKDYDGFSVMLSKISCVRKNLREK